METITGTNLQKVLDTFFHYHPWVEEDYRKNKIMRMTKYGNYDFFSTGYGDYVTIKKYIPSNTSKLYYRVSYCKAYYGY